MEQIEVLKKKIDELNMRLMEYYIHRDTSTSAMPDGYYEVQREKMKIENELRLAYEERDKARQSEQLKASENSENPERYITSGTYERALKRTEKAVLRNIGVL